MEGPCTRREFLERTTMLGVSLRRATPSDDAPRSVGHVHFAAAMGGRAQRRMAGAGAASRHAPATAASTGRSRRRAPRASRPRAACCPSSRFARPSSTCRCRRRSTERRRRSRRSCRSWPTTRRSARRSAAAAFSSCCARRPAVASKEERWKVGSRSIGLDR